MPFLKPLKEMQAVACGEYCLVKTDGAGSNEVSPTDCRISIQYRRPLAVPYFGEKGEI